MQDTLHPVVNRRGPKPEFPGLTEDAAELGVSRYFLWQVLKGHATSAPLLTRYKALKTRSRMSENLTIKTQT
jgi:hypothetical protein